MGVPAGLPSVNAENTNYTKLSDELKPQQWQNTIYFRRVGRIWQLGGDVQVESFHIVTLLVANLDLYRRHTRTHTVFLFNQSIPFVFDTCIIHMAKYKTTRNVGQCPT